MTPEQRLDSLRECSYCLRALEQLAQHIAAKPADLNTAGGFLLTPGADIVPVPVEACIAVLDALTAAYVQRLASLGVPVPAEDAP